MKNLLILAPLFILLSACGSGGGKSTTTMPASVRRTELQMAVATARENGFPSGTKIYGSDLVTIYSGKAQFVVGSRSTVRRTQDGGYIVRDYRGNVLQSFPRTARLEVVHNGVTQAVRPDRPVPPEYKNATPLEIVK